MSLRWELEGHEADMEGLRIATPTLQARLIGGVKAEQVTRSSSEEQHLPLTSL